MAIELPKTTKGVNQKSKIGLDEFGKFLKEKERDVNYVQREFMGRLITLLIASLGLITALAWDEMLRALFARVVPNSDGLGAKALYALVITLLAALISVLLGRLFLKKTKE